MKNVMAFVGKTKNLIGQTGLSDRNVIMTSVYRMVVVVIGNGQLKRSSLFIDKSQLISELVWEYSSIVC